MAYRASARRYAQAAFELALEADDLDGWLEDLQAIGTAVETESLGDALDSPQLTSSRKGALIDELFGDSIRPLPRNLLGLLASKNSARIAPDLANEFAAMVDSHRGVVRAEVVTAAPMDSEQAARLADMLRDVAGREVVISSREDPGILGGLIAQVGDKVIDGSTRTRLEGMRKRLVHGR